MSEPTIKACPRCGGLWANSCWHSNTDDLQTVMMPASKAMMLCKGHLGYLRSRVAQHESFLADIEAKLLVKCAGCDNTPCICDLLGVGEP